ncbi:cytochrome c3 family protein [Deferrisoma camini]|uniref:cytochrome c3 family protein n=1 Tax=Deferrisoma camini TaxID=1035120 RepID=UPI00046D1C2A|nr:cytochrome c3 family protein [Deferrisoma camini]
MRTALLAALVSLPLAAAPAAARELPRLLAPAETGVVRTPQVLLVYTVPAGEQTFVRADGRRLDRKGVSVPGDREDLFHLQLPLKEGRNRFEIVRAVDEKVRLSFTVTYVPPYSLRTPVAPGDRPYAFHTREREAGCSGCHNLPETYETVPDRPLAPAGKVCGACHPGIEKAPNLHGPTAVYACFMCHDPQYRSARFTIAASQPAGCGRCHEDFLARILGGKKFVHGPVAAGGCLVCHDPHGGKTTAVLREAPPKLCLLCHADTLPLPVDKGLHGSVPCTQCHNPHGGDTRILTAKAGNEFCAGCHPDVAEGGRGHPVAGHPVEAEVDPSLPGRPLGCVSCHAPHGVSDVSRARILENEQALTRFCRKCHY